MCFKRGDVQGVAAAAIRTTEHDKVLKDIHLTKTDRCPMGCDTGIKQQIPCSTLIAVMTMPLSLSRGILRNDRADTQIMSRFTRRTGQDHRAMFPYALDRYTEGMDRPALLKKRSAANNLGHGCSSTENVVQLYLSLNLNLQKVRGPHHIRISTTPA